MRHAVGGRKNKARNARARARRAHHALLVVLVLHIVARHGGRHARQLIGGRACQQRVVFEGEAPPVCVPDVGLRRGGAQVHHVEVVAGRYRGLVAQLDGEPARRVDIGGLKGKFLPRPGQSRKAHHAQYPLRPAGRYYHHLHAVGHAAPAVAQSLVGRANQRYLHAGRRCGRRGRAHRNRIGGIAQLGVRHAHKKAFARLYPRQIHALLGRGISENIYPHVQLTEQAVRVQRAPGAGGLLHAAAGRAGAPGQKVRGRVAVEGEIGVGLVARLFVKLSVQRGIVHTPVKLNKRIGIQRVRVTAHVNGHLPTSPPELELAGRNARNAGARQVLVIQFV